MRTAFFLALFLFATRGGLSAQDISANSPFYLGADIGWVTEMEDSGHTFRAADGQPTDCFALLRSLGLNAIRLRVWVDPSAHGNYCGKDDFLRKARRTVAAGMALMVDFHYSDWWADPGQQNIPASWRAFSYDEMCLAVAAHTRDILSALRDEGIAPTWIQIGNETSNGFLWPMGHIDEQPAQYAGLFRAGYAAAKDIFPDAIVMVHLDNGYDQALYDKNLGVLRDNGATWDMVGMSLYPYWAAQVDSMLTADDVIARCMENIKHVRATFGSDVMIVETGMLCANEQGQLAADSVLVESRRQLATIIDKARHATDGNCHGVFYWEPECRPAQYQLGAFTADGQPTIIMEAFRR